MKRRSRLVADRLGHEGRGFAVGRGDLMDDVFGELDPIAGFQQAPLAEGKPMLTGGRPMFVAQFGEAQIMQHDRDLVTNIAVMIRRG